MKSFNTYGPCRPEDHYMLPAAERLPSVRGVIDRKIYFVLHAPRQVGKTTAIMELARQLTDEGRHVALMVSLEGSEPFKDDPGAAELAILGEIRSASKARLPQSLQPPPWPDAPPGQRLREALREWASAAPARAVS